MLPYSSEYSFASLISGSFDMNHACCSQLLASHLQGTGTAQPQHVQLVEPLSSLREPRGLIDWTGLLLLLNLILVSDENDDDDDDNDDQSSAVEEAPSTTPRERGLHSKLGSSRVNEYFK